MISAEDLYIRKDLRAHVESSRRLRHSQALHVFISWKQQDNTGVKIPAWLVSKVIQRLKST